MLDEMYRLIVEAVPEGIWILNPQGQTIFSNRRMAEILGIAFESMPGQSCFACVFPDELHEAQRHFARCLDGDSSPFDFRLRRGDGSPIWVSISCMAVRDGDVDVGLLGLFSDISERKHAEAVLRESEERFRNLADTAPVLLWMSGAGKVCTYFNRRWLEFTGRTIEAELGNGWAEGVHPDDMALCLATYKEAYDRRERFRMEYRLRRRDGEYRWLLDTGVPRFTPDGSFLGYIGSAIDVTDHKLAEETLSTLSGKLLEAQEEERRRIARELHDDLGQRLVFLSLQLNSMGAGPSSAERRKLSDHAEALIKSVRDISHRLHSSNIEHLGIVSAAKGFCNELSEQQKLQVLFSHDGIPEDLPQEIAFGLFRVLQEALNNAMKHSGAQQVVVELHGSRDEIQLEVVDRGAGFELDHAMRCQGLGLVSMRERLRLIKGDLVIQSLPGQGTRVRACVPLSRMDQPLAQAASIRIIESKIADS
jgi:PAS domain S-box-containing protein